MYLCLENPNLKVPPGEGGGPNLIDIEGGQNKTQVKFHIKGVLKEEY